MNWRLWVKRCDDMTSFKKTLQIDEVNNIFTAKAQRWKFKSSYGRVKSVSFDSESDNFLNSFKKMRDNEKKLSYYSTL